MTPFQWHQKRQHTGMSVVAESLLDLILTRPDWNVMALLHLGRNLGVGSIATLHSNLKWLDTHGYVQFTVPITDQRVKLVRMSGKGTTYLSTPA